MKKKSIWGLLVVFLLSMAIAGCGKKEIGLDLASKNQTDSGSKLYEVPAPGSYDSAGTAVVTKVNEKGKTISFYDYELNKSYTLNYDGVTRFADKYDTAIAIAQLKTGMIVDVLFLKSEKLLVSVRENKDTFTYTDVTGFLVDTGTKVFKYKDESYKISAGTVLLDRSGMVSFAELNAMDKVTITGIDTKIYSIKIENGHGYLSFKNDAYFIGGFVEIGKDVEKISDKMLMTIPEGDYDVHITAKGADATKKVSIKANEETVLNLGDIEIEETKIGQVLFIVDPKDAAVAIDGKVVDQSKLLEYEYGLHQIVVSAKGYDTLVRYFKVAEEKATLAVTLDKTEDTKDDKKEEISKTDGYYVYITAPSDVEVYVDNVYIGISPVAYAKKSGTHSITLRKTGYVTRSFNVEIANTSEDVRYAFDTLAKEETVQKNDVSSNDTTKP